MTRSQVLGHDHLDLIVTAPSRWEHVTLRRRRVRHHQGEQALVMVWPACEPWLLEQLDHLSAEYVERRVPRL